MTIGGAISGATDGGSDVPSPHRWRVELFGGPAVERAGQPRVARFVKTNVAMLLAVLAYPPRREHTREALATMLWPDAAPNLGRNSLSQALMALRKETGLPIEAFGQEVSLPAGVVECDVDLFLSALARADAAPVGDDAALDRHLSAALAVRTGEFLPGLLHEWVIDRRRDLTERYLKALCDLSGCKSRLGDADSAIAVARQAVAIDGWDERGHIALLRALVLAGRTAAATRHLRELEAKWRAEFGEEVPVGVRDASVAPVPSAPPAPFPTTHSVGTRLPPSLGAWGDGESGGEGGVSNAALAGSGDSPHNGTPLPPMPPRAGEGGCHLSPSLSPASSDAKRSFASSNPA